MKISVSVLAIVVLLLTGPFVEYAESASVQNDTTTKTIDPNLNEIEDDFLNRQAQALLNQVNEVIDANPPQLPEPLLRRMSLLTLDGVLHDVYAPQRPPVQDYFHTRIEKAVQEIENTRVDEGAMIWKLYDHGFVVRTATVTLAFDLIRAVYIEGFALPDELVERIVNECDVLFISHRHGDHADEWVAQMFLDQEKPVAAPSQAWEDKPIHSRITHLKREAHTLQSLSVQKGKNELRVVNNPGHQGPEVENNVPIVFTPEGMSFVQTGDQWDGGNDFDWIDAVREHHRVDVLMPNCWSMDIARVVQGFDPQLVITGHENEMGHSIDKRVPYWLTYERKTGSDSYGGNQAKGYDKPLVVMTWGEKYHYKLAGD